MLRPNAVSPGCRKAHRATGRAIHNHPYIKAANGGHRRIYSVSTMLELQISNLSEYDNLCV